MTISQIKNDISNHMGSKAIIKYNLGRNKYEKYDVIIKEMYDNVFLVEHKNNNDIFIKSFSYSDIITKIIKINY